MKMSQQLFQKLQAAVSPYVHTTSGETKRQRWDVLWRAVDEKRFDILECYAAGLDDAHIDTALRTIFFIVSGERP